MTEYRFWLRGLHVGIKWINSLWDRRGLILLLAMQNPFFWLADRFVKICRKFKVQSGHFKHYPSEQKSSITIKLICVLPYLHILPFIAFLWCPPKVTILLYFSWFMTHFHILFHFYSSQPVSGTDTCSLLYCCTPQDWQRNGEKKYCKKKNPCFLRQFLK